MIRRISASFALPARACFAPPSRSVFPGTTISGCAHATPGTAITTRANDPAPAEVVTPPIQPAGGSLSAADSKGPGSGSPFGQEPSQGNSGETRNDEDAKSPIVRHLLDALNGLSEGTSEEHDLLRDILHDADAELHNSLGENSLRKIQAANNPGTGFGVGRPTLNLSPPPADQNPGNKQPAAEPTTPAKQPSAEPLN